MKGKKLTLNKVTVTKLNNLNRIRGGNETNGETGPDELSSQYCRTKLD